MNLSNESRQQLQRACEILGVEFTQRDDVIPALVVAITDRLAVLVHAAAAAQKAREADFAKGRAWQAEQDAARAAAQAAPPPPLPEPKPVEIVPGGPPPGSQPPPNVPPGKKLCPKCNGTGGRVDEQGLRWMCVAEEGGCNGAGYVAA